MLAPVHRIAAVWPTLISANGAYMARSVAAAALALGLGFYLQLDSPFTAASTVLLLLNPVKGAVVGKGFYRVLGTVIGLCASFVLMGLFAQKVLLLIIGMGVWLGVCTLAMGLLRHYAVTAAVVAGYTVCLALGPALVEPMASFQHIATRGTAVILGVLSISLIAAVFSNKTVEPKLHTSLRNVAARSLGVIAGHLDDADVSQEGRGLSSLATDIGKIEDLLGVGRGESHAISSKIAVIRAGLFQLMAAVVEVNAGPDAARFRDAQPALWADLTGTLANVAEALGRNDVHGFTPAEQAITALVSRLRQNYPPALSVGFFAENVELFIERFSARLDDLHGALACFSCLENGAPLTVPKVGFHRNHADALQNGLRACAAYLAGGFIWYSSGWDQGPTVFAVLGPCCTLFAASALPVNNTMGFIRGTLYAVPAAAVCKFLVFPLINGFPLLVFTLACFWLCGIYATTKPRYALQGVAYLIVFNTLASTGLTAGYDVAEFANEALATLVALYLSLFMFQVFPRTQGATVGALRNIIHRETSRLLDRDGPRNPHLWQARQQHRMIMAQSNANQDEAARTTHLARLSIQLARELDRLRTKLVLRANEDTGVLQAYEGLARLTRHRNNFHLAAAQARRTANALKRSGCHGLATAFDELVRLLSDYACEFEPSVFRREQ